MFYKVFNYPKISQNTKLSFLKSHFLGNQAHFVKQTAKTEEKRSKIYQTHTSCVNSECQLEPQERQQLYWLQIATTPTTSNNKCVLKVFNLRYFILFQL